MTMPRGNGAKTRRSARRAASPGTLVEGARRAPDPAPALAPDGAPPTHIWATDPELDELFATLAPKVGTCTNCTHMALKHPDGGACSVDGCSCTSFEAEASVIYDEVEYTTTVAGEIFVAGFDPAPDRFDAAIAELVHRSPEAEPLVRLRLEELRLRRFAPDSPAPPLTPPLDAGGDGYTLEWDAVLCPEGRLTEDGRAFAPGSIRWRDLPLSLAAMLETQPGHDGAKVCGRIDRIWRDEAAGLIRAAGVFDDSKFGREIARMVADGILRGNSVDIAPLEVEVGPASRWFDPDGNWIPQEAAVQQDEPTLDDVLFGEPGGEPTIVVVNDAVIGMSTVCPFPAFADARIAVGESVVAAGSPLVWTLKVDAGYRLTRRPRARSRPTPEPVVDVDAPAAGVAITAAGVAVGIPDVTGVDANVVVDVSGTPIGTWTLDPTGTSWAPEALTAAVTPPVHPPAAWFADPGLDHLSPLVVTDDGRIYGHAAGWGSCHTGFPDVCVTPPHSETGYRFYLLKTVECDDGTEVDVGTITLEAPHANQSLGLVEASAHYDNTAMAAADVIVGEDEHGIWVAGAIRPHLTAEMVRELRGASLSGDWRNYDGNLELVALLAVNVPGFPIPHVRARVAGGQMQTLVAAGLVLATGTSGPGSEPEPPGEWLPPAVDASTAAKLAALASTALAAVAE